MCDAVAGDATIGKEIAGQARNDSIVIWVRSINQTGSDAVCKTHLQWVNRGKKSVQ